MGSVRLRLTEKVIYGKYKKPENKKGNKMEIAFW